MNRDSILESLDRMFAEMQVLSVYFSDKSFKNNSERHNQIITESANNLVRHAQRTLHCVLEVTQI